MTLFNTTKNIRDTGTRFWHWDFWDCLGNYGKMCFYNGHQGNNKPIKAYVGYQNNSIQAPKVGT